MAKKKEKEKKKTKRRKFKKGFAKWLRIIKILGVLFIVFSAYILYCMTTLPNIEEAIHRNRTPSTTILAENGNEIQSFGTVYSEVVYLNELPKYVVDAVVATEDRRFYSHFGFDFIGFARAMATNLWAGRFKQGGSTISQQVAKNLFLTSKKNITRKTQELLLAFWLEYKFSKEQILTLYLNRVYLGTGVYGIEAASQRYFEKSSRYLNPLEAAIIAGMLKAPSRYNPVADRDRAVERAYVVLAVMVKNGYMTKEEAEAAKKMPLGPEKSYLIGGAKHFADLVYSEANSYVGEREEDIYVLSTLDERIQLATEKILKAEIALNKDRNVSEGAVVVMDYNGAIKALAGGVNYNKSQFNRATQALRQSGSTFKPFVYITALQEGWGTMDIISDRPIQVKDWKPENYDKKHYGDVTLLHGITKSLNLAAIDLSNKVGRDKIIRNAKKMGITTKIQNSPSLALGAFEVRVIDMAAAYTSIANGGQAVFPHTVEEVFTKDGYQLYMREGEYRKRIFDEKTAVMMKDMLKNVIDNGTGRKARIPGLDTAGKTGTTQDYRDAWFIGFTDKYVCAVWVGNDDNSSMKGITGGDLPAVIWKKVILKAHESQN